MVPVSYLFPQYHHRYTQEEKPNIPEEDTSKRNKETDKNRRTGPPGFAVWLLDHETHSNLVSNV